MKEIAVLVSGGVDSSVALSLLKEKGYPLRAYYLKIWLADELSHLNECPWEEDLSYVQSLCKTLDVPLEVISMQKEYWDNVVAYTIEEIKKGHTPNPDMLCNREVKLGAFLRYIHDTHDYVATGHYARQITHSNKKLLCLTEDPIKDQTYFLAQVPYAYLSRALFPLGDLTKKDVRTYAEEKKLPSATRPDSQGICFLGKIRFKEFVKHHLGILSGDLVEWETKKTIGKHEGYWFYTIGQRQGLGLSGGPWYVVHKNTQENIVYISRAYYSEEKNRNQIRITGCNWISDEPLLHEDYYVKLRHGPTLHSARVTNIENGHYELVLKERDQGIAKGQFAVLYTRNRICIGSGTLV